MRWSAISCAIGIRSNISEFGKACIIRFQTLEFEGFRKEAGLNAFTLSPQKWINTTNAIGIISKSGRYGGTYAHKDIAFKFASWISVEFELYIVKEFQRLKEEEQKQLGWSAKRELSKINYRIHTDAIKQNLIPAEVTAKQASIIYANEADVLNGAMFGMTAKTWREQNPDLKGNIRDYATINELICLSNMENLNAVFIDQKMPQGERLVKLNRIAIQQMQVLRAMTNGNYWNSAMDLRKINSYMILLAIVVVVGLFVSTVARLVILAKGWMQVRRILFFWLCWVPVR